MFISHFENLEYQKNLQKILDELHSNNIVEKTYFLTNMCNTNQSMRMNSDLCCNSNTSKHIVQITVSNERNVVLETPIVPQKTDLFIQFLGHNITKSGNKFKYGVLKNVYKIFDKFVQYVNSKLPMYGV